MPREHSLIGVVEDDPVMGGTLVHRLELEGYEAVWWRTGEQAIQGLRTVRPDVVVCDIRLPDASGEQVFLSVLPQLGGCRSSLSPRTDRWSRRFGLLRQEQSTTSRSPTPFPICSIAFLG